MQFPKDLSSGKQTVKGGCAIKISDSNPRFTRAEDLVVSAFPVAGTRSPCVGSGLSLIII